MKQILLIFLLLFSIAVSKAQILNVEKARKGSTDKNIVGQLGLKFNINNRNSTPSEESLFLQLGASSNVSYLTANNTYILIGDLSYNSLGGDAFISNGYLHYRNHLRYDKKLSYEQFNQWQFDAGRGLNNRLLSGFGIRYNVKDSGRYNLSAGVGIMGEYEAWWGENLVIERILPKASNYVSMKYDFNDAVKINLTVYYQVGYDWQYELWRNRISNDLQIECKLSDRLFFTTTFVSTFEDAPIIPINPFIFNLENGFRIKF